MSKRHEMRSGGWSLAAATLSLFAGLGCKPVPSGPPPRPSTVPASASWAGGPDGGAWIRCSKAARAYECEVFQEDGSLWTRGRFVLSPGSKEQKTLDFDAYDGESIHLTGGGALVPARK